MTALFTVLAIDAFRARRDIPTPALAAACALTARFLFPGQMLLAAFAVFTAGLLARHAYPRKACTCGDATPCSASSAAPPFTPPWPARCLPAERGPSMTTSPTFTSTRTSRMGGSMARSRS
jgi:hypothetical protein